MKFLIFFGIGVFLFLVGTFLGIGEIIFSVLGIGGALIMFILVLGGNVLDGRTVAILEFLGESPDENLYRNGKIDKFFENLDKPRVVKGWYLGWLFLHSQKAVLDISNQTLTYRTPDNALIDVPNGALSAEVRAVVRVINPVSALYNATETTPDGWKNDIVSGINVGLRNAFLKPIVKPGKILPEQQTLEELLLNGRTLSQDITDYLVNSGGPADILGVEIVRLDIEDISPSPEILKARELALIEEQRKAAQLIRAQGILAAKNALLSGGSYSDEGAEAVVNLILSGEILQNSNITLYGSDLSRIVQGLTGR